MKNTKKTFAKSFAAGVFTLTLLSGCAWTKEKLGMSNCSGKSSCSAKKTEKNTCKAKSSCSSKKQ